ESRAVKILVISPAAKLVKLRQLAGALHVTKPFAGIGFEPYHIHAFKRLKKLFRQVIGHPVAYVHGTIEVRRLFKVVAAYFPEQGGIFFGALGKQECGQYKKVKNELLHTIKIIINLTN